MITGYTHLDKQREYMTENDLVHIFIEIQLKQKIISICNCK